MTRGVRYDLQRISDSCKKRVGSRVKTRKQSNYRWTGEIGKLWKESCLARRRFIGRKRLLIRQGGYYENIVNDKVLASFKAE